MSSVSEPSRYAGGESFETSAESGKYKPAFSEVSAKRMVSGIANLPITATVIPSMPNPPSRHISPALVALAGWVIPGGGYFLLGERKCAYTVGLSIILLFLMGILIGGIRIMDPPGWGEYGYMDQLIARPGRQQSEGIVTKVEPSSDEQENDPRSDNRDEIIGTALLHEPLMAISDKPWFVCQILCGPATLVFSAASAQLRVPCRTRAARTAHPLVPFALLGNRCPLHGRRRHVESPGHHRRDVSGQPQN